jgi:hypothetical protein
LFQNEVNTPPPPKKKRPKSNFLSISCKKHSISESFQAWAFSFSFATNSFFFL